MISEVGFLGAMESKAENDAKWFAETYNVSRETCSRLETYQALLQKWQKAINLVGASTIDDFWRRHAADSAQLLALAPTHWQKWLDIGSGGGFPGLVIALLLAERTALNDALNDAPPAMVHLIESDQRKCTFMRTVIRETGALAEVHEGRVEDIALEKAGGSDVFTQIDVISARALAPLPRLLELAAPYFATHTNTETKGLFLKGKNWAEELQKAEQYWQFDVEVVESRTNKDARILVCGYPQLHKAL